MSLRPLSSVPEPAWKHYPALDGIRGTAVLIVFVYHYGGGAQSSNRIIHLIGRVTLLGWSGVSLFFVLSGFLITGLLWDARESKHWWKGFYLRRVLRIFPLYYTALLLVFISAVLSGNGHASLHHLWRFAFYLQNVPGLWDVGNDNGSSFWLSHFWSLAVEEQFYLLWPVLLMRSRDIDRAKKLCLGVFLFSLAVRFILPLEYALTLVAQSGSLAMGCYLALCFRQPQTWAKLQKASRYVPLLCLAVIALIALRTGEVTRTIRPMFIWGELSFTIFYGLLIVQALGRGPVHSIMCARPLRKIGVISYGFYAYHVLFHQKYWGIATLLAPHASPKTHAAILAVVAFVLTYAVALLSFRYFEQPILRLSNRLSLLKQRPTAVQPELQSATLPG